MTKGEYLHEKHISNLSNLLEQTRVRQIRIQATSNERARGYGLFQTNCKAARLKRNYTP